MSKDDKKTLWEVLYGEEGRKQTQVNFRSDLTERESRYDQGN